MNLTICYTTARAEPHIEWFLDSLANQRSKDDHIEVIIVDLNCSKQWPDVETLGENIIRVSPKPNIWQGPYRITKQDWWAKSNALNTGICLARHDWFAAVDDRSVLGPKWLETVRLAQRQNFAICGSYEKRHGLCVEKGKITNQGQLTGRDNRLKRRQHRLTFGNDWYGCTNALPLEWALKVNGYPEEFCDGHSYEDTTFGGLLTRNGLGIHFKPDMMVIEDRTPGSMGPDIRREDKGKSPKDKSHALVRTFQGARDSKNSFSIRAMRDLVLSGKPFPMPTAKHHDWYDSQPIKDFA